jgi:hypothetical protein
MAAMGMLLLPMELLPNDFSLRLVLKTIRKAVSPCHIHVHVDYGPVVGKDEAFVSLSLYIAGVYV